MTGHPPPAAHRHAPDVLVVASMRRWVAEEFTPAARAAGLELRHSWGLDVPDLAGYARPAWWTPTEHAVRLQRAGVSLPLLAPGPSWLSRVPAELTGRPIWSGQVADLGHAPPAGWAKPAEAKVGALPAGWWERTTAFARAARAAGLPQDSWVQVSPVRLDLEVEHRCFIAAGAVVAASPYLLADGTTYFDGMVELAGLGAPDATRFAADVVAAMGRDQPPAYTLDVARTRDGAWVVIEANPVWSSATYGADMGGVLASVLAGVDHTGQHPGWAWHPDPWLARRAAAQPVLPRG